MALFNVSEVVRSNVSELIPRLIETGQCQTTSSAKEGGWLEIKGEEEMKGGFLNKVYRVLLVYYTSCTTNTNNNGVEFSVIVKHAPPYKKCLPSVPLNQNRATFEYSAFETLHKHFPGCVPIPLHFDYPRKTIFMEYLSGWRPLQCELLDGIVDITAIDGVMGCAARIHNLALSSSEEHTKLCKQFCYNEAAINVTEENIFTKPFILWAKIPGANDVINTEAARLRSDVKCMERVKELKMLAIECNDCFIHGDLHTGSIMVKDGQFKLIDLELAAMGPGWYDLGIFLANLLMTLIRHHVLNNVGVVTKIREAIATSIQQYMSTATIGEKDMFIRDTCGFIGVEMIRKSIDSTSHNSPHFISLPEARLKSLVLGRAFLSTTTTTVYGGSLEMAINKTIKDNFLTDN